MTLLSRPMVEDKIRLAVELQTYHENLAKAAQASEEIIGDLVYASEINTRAFMRTFYQLASIYRSFLELYATDNLLPAPLNSLILHFQHHITEDTKNTANRQSLLALEGQHDDDYHFHTAIASDLDLRYLVLLCFKDELLLREQGFTKTPLHDVDLNI